MGRTQSGTGPASSLSKTSPRLASGWGASLLALAFTCSAGLVLANDLPIGAAPEPEEATPEPPPAPVEEDAPVFFDEELPTEAEAIVYVVDRSSSMSLPVAPYLGLDGNVVSNGNRLGYVKTEIKRSINSLSDAFSFNIVIYDECIEAWKPLRQQATAQKKAEAMAWVDAIQPWGWTNTGGAASLALADDANRMVLLLSDGAPNFLDCAQSYVADFDTHRLIIRQSNAQNAVIHTFGIGLDAETRTFLQRVAQDNGGTFREVD